MAQNLLKVIEVMCTWGWHKGAMWWRFKIGYILNAVDANTDFVLLPPKEGISGRNTCSLCLLNSYTVLKKCRTTKKARQL